ncbi:HEAT repeat domain-containing protein [Aerosakkonemataceae cyanobacterium BLCC-F50]|uniref:HEAT repeat domain-containing protein n=1 Tax=Floridaenema flaviceps BLCC-F50 TaxID=3153642 RepID=A0ABV4XLR4_9CYAN
MSFYTEFDQLNVEDLKQRFCASPPEGEEYATVYYQEIGQLIQERGEEAIDFLKNAIKTANTSQLQGILFALSNSQQKDGDLKTLLLSYLQDHRSIIVMEAVDALSRLGAKDTLDYILALREHSSPYVRASVLRFLRRWYPEIAFNLLVEALKDPDFIVRENAADELGELEITEAIDYLNPLLKDPHPDVRQAAQTAIEILQA